MALEMAAKRGSLAHDARVVGCYPAVNSTKVTPATSSRHRSRLTDEGFFGRQFASAHPPEATASGRRSGALQTEGEPSRETLRRRRVVSDPEEVRIGTSSLLAETDQFSV
jgi:hypothetical protein